MQKTPSLLKGLLETLNLRTLEVTNFNFKVLRIF